MSTVGEIENGVVIEWEDGRRTTYPKGCSVVLSAEEERRSSSIQVNHGEVIVERSEYINFDGVLYVQRLRWWNDGHGLPRSDHRTLEA